MKRATLVISILLFAVLTVLAAVISTDNFDSYTPTNDLNTLNGGSGWTGAWAKITGGAMTIETAPAGGQGGNAVRSISATVDTQYSRAVTAITVGTVRFRMRTTIANPNNFSGAVLRESTNGRMYIRFGPTGNLEIYNNTGATYESIQAYSVDTWYTIDINFDNAAQPNLYRAAVGGGAYTAYKTVNGGSYTNVDDMMLDDSATNAHTFWVDDIRPIGFPQYYYRMMSQL